MNETAGIVLCFGVGVTELIGCFVVLVSGQAITRDARFNGSCAQRWSMIRRFIYWGAAISLIALAAYRLDNLRSLALLDGIAQIYCALFIVFFPLMRALKVISQDRLVDGNGVSKMLDRITDGNGE